MWPLRHENKWRKRWRVKSLYMKRWDDIEVDVSATTSIEDAIPAQMSISVTICERKMKPRLTLLFDSILLLILGDGAQFWFLIEIRRWSLRDLISLPWMATADRPSCLPENRKSVANVRIQMSRFRFHYLWACLETFHHRRSALGKHRRALSSYLYNTT